jgi:hypothetical protein
MKKLILYIFVFALTTISIPVSILLLESPVLSQKEDKSNSNHPENIKEVKEKKYKGNKNLPKEKFIEKEKAIGKIPKQAALVEANFKDWQDLKSKKLKGIEVEDISPDRMIWDVQFKFPDGVEVGGDKYYDANVTKVVDGETGDLLYFKVSAPLDKIKQGKKNRIPKVN